MIGIAGSITGAQTPRRWPHCSKKFKEEGTRAAGPRAFLFTAWRFMHMRAGRSLFRPFSGHPDLKYTYSFYAHVHEIIKAEIKSNMTVLLDTKLRTKSIFRTICSPDQTYSTAGKRLVEEGRGEFGWIRLQPSNPPAQRCRIRLQPFL